MSQTIWALAGATCILFIPFSVFRGSSAVGRRQLGKAAFSQKLSRDVFLTPHRHPPQQGGFRVLDFVENSSGTAKLRAWDRVKDAKLIGLEVEED